MSIRIPFSMVVALATFTLAAPLTAQTRSTVSTSVLDAAVSVRPANNRAVVAAALSSSNAVAIASRMGLSANDVAARVAALDDASAQQVADRVLAGGDNVVISATAVIIILLLVILLTR